MHAHFLKLKSNLELDETLNGSISTKHNAIRSYVENNNPSVKDTKLIGSLQRKTRIHPGTDGDIDIDILVVMGEFHRWVPEGGIAPAAALNSLHSTMENSDRYVEKDPTQDAPAVCLSYDDGIDVELVPAYIDHIGYDQYGNSTGPKGRGYWVPKNGKWEIVDYDYEAEYVSALNQITGGYLIPTIKMLKAIKRKYFEELGSFPLEIVATQVVPVIVASKRAHGGAIYYHDLLKEFFEQAAPSLYGTLRMPGSKSSPVTLSSKDQRSIETKFAQIAEYIRQTNLHASQEKKIERWRTLIGDHFPVTI